MVSSTAAAAATSLTAPTLDPDLIMMKWSSNTHPRNNTTTTNPLSLLRKVAQADVVDEHPRERNLGSLGGTQWTKRMLLVSIWWRLSLCLLIW